MDFRVLGPLAVEDERGQLALDGPRVRALLALLLLRANAPVSTSELLDELWGEDLPKSGANAVQNAVARLRRSLGDRIVTVGSAYLIRVEPGELDLQRFRDTVERAPALPPEQRATLLRDALAEWHGEPLGSMGSAAFVFRERSRLQGERLEALESRIDADLELGRHAALVPEISALVVEHPLDERFRAQLMLALYRSGRQAAALDVYRETRQVLADELGLEPSPALRELERAVLRQDAGLDPPRPVRRDVEEPRRGRRLLLVAGLAALFAAGTATAIVVAPGGHSEARSARTSMTGAPTAAVTAPRTSSVTSTRTGPVAHQPRARHGHRVVRPVTSSTAAATTRAAVTTTPPPGNSASTGVQTTTAAKITETTKVTTRRATTRTTTTVRTTTSTTTVRDASGPPLANDTFDGPVDPSFWHTYTLGTGPAVAQENGRVEVFIPADATPFGPYAQISGAYEVRCEFPADFDAQVAFELVQLLPGNGISAKLTASIHNGTRSDVYPQVFRRSLRGQEHYHSYVVVNGLAVDTQDRAGRLRIARRNNVLVTYYWRGERWVKMDSATLPGTARIDFAAMTGGAEWGKRDTTVAFDDFVLFASRADCS